MFIKYKVKGLKMFQKYRVKPYSSGMEDIDKVYTVQRKIFIWWTIKYFKSYKAADLWIDKNIMGK